MNHKPLLGFALAIALVACPSTTTPTPPPALPSLEGVWAAQSGSGIFDALTDTTPLKFLQLTTSGSGKAFAVNTSSNVLACAPLLFAVNNANVVSVSSSVLFGFNNAGGASTKLLNFALTNATTLSLTDENGNAQTFTKAASVPNSNQCAGANITAKLENLPVVPASFTNLVSDGTNLRLADDTSTVRILNPTTGAQVSTESLSLAGQYTQIMAMQGADYWAHCGCGGSQDVHRVKPSVSTPVKAIDTDTNLGRRIGVRAGAWDGTNLWLGGYGADSKQHVLRVNSEAATVTLISQFEFGSSLQALTFQDGALWALVYELGPKLAQIDTTTGKATRTLDLPAVTNGSYQGLASLNGRLYVMIRNYANTTTILNVLP